MPKLPALTLTLNYGPHARRAAADDQYTDLTRYLPETIELGAVQVIELDTFENIAGKEVVEKLLVRFSIGDGLDLCLVILRNPHDWFVKTVWANLTSDTHRTLRNREQFAKAPRKANGN